MAFPQQLQGIRGCLFQEIIIVKPLYNSHIMIIIHGKTRIIYVVVNFLSQVIFVFLLFLGMVMYANEIETKEK